MSPFASEGTFTSESREVAVSETWDTWSNPQSSSNVEVVNGSLQLAEDPSIENFEGGDLSAYGGDTADFSVQDSTVFDGTYALESSASSAVIARTDSQVTVSEPFTLSVWMRGASSSNHAFMFDAQNENGFDSFTGYAIRVRHDQSLHAISTFSNGSINRIADTTFDPPDDEWYELQVSQDGSDISSTVYDESGTELSNVPTTDSSHTGGGIGFWSQSSGGTYWDYVVANP